MSFFSFLGGVGKGILKGAGTVGKMAANIAGQQLGVGAIFQAGSGSDVAQTADPPSLNSGQFQNVAQQSYVARKQDTSNAYQGTKAQQIADGLVDTFNRLNPKIEVDHTVAAPSGMPSWLMPAGIAAVGVLLVTQMSGKRR